MSLFRGFPLTPGACASRPQDSNTHNTSDQLLLTITRPSRSCQTFGIALKIDWTNILRPGIATSYTLNPTTPAASAAPLSHHTSRPSINASRPIPSALQSINGQSVNSRLHAEHIVRSSGRKIPMPLSVIMLMDDMSMARILQVSMPEERFISWKNSLPRRHTGWLDG